ncbi:MAG: TolC family protein [Gammaproteobacteria bacterium]|nr:TolC family protein [Gammaproteobacteria bacterium]NNJ49862.1 TolC family protein [Gammaproteobacteria bacterium]
MLIKDIFSNNTFSPKLSLLLSLVLATGPSAAQQWTLESSVQQAMMASPELKKSSAELGARQQDINLSSLWPDPEIAFRVDNKMGQDDGAGGYDLTDIVVRQSIPVSRLKHQESAAEASLQAARFSHQYHALQVQNRVARVFHQLQFASAVLTLAEKQQKLADEMYGQEAKESAGVVVRYLSPLEKMRLGIIQEEARQSVISAEGKYKEALSEFVKLLGIEIDSVISVSQLLPISVIPDKSRLATLQDSHAQLSSQQQQVLAANHEIDVARTTQMIDPTIGLSWSKDTLSTGREDIYAIMFNIQIPITDRKDTAASKATYKASQQKIELQLLKRELKINLNRSYTHLHHVIEQAAEYKKKVLKPAEKMLELTNKGFTSGELNILSLVDANNTYFEARLSYLELLYQSRVELADVKLYAGQMITDVAEQNLGSSEGGS